MSPIRTRPRNPVHLALPALAELTTTQWDRGNSQFPPTSFQISNVTAGTGVDNMIPGEFILRFNFRFNTCHSAAQLQQQVEALLQRHDLNFDLEWQLSGNPFGTPTGKLVNAVDNCIEQMLGVSPERSTGGGTSDGRFIAPTGAEVVEFGPRNGSIHKINEHVSIADLDALSQVYEDLIGRLPGQR